MTTAYFDCFSGISGDMVLGSLIDAGMPLSYLKKELSRISFGGYRIGRKQRGLKHHFQGTNLHIEVKSELKDTRYVSIASIIKRSRLKPAVKDLSLFIMERLAKAESLVHRVTLSKVHFHEVGGVDSIIDCVGSAIGVDYFGFESIVSSPLPVTRGKIKCAHGMIPVPAPATLEILKSVPLEPSPINDEIVTPTGAAIITTIASHFGSCPLQRIERVGYGFGDKVFPGIPNCLRLMIGEGFPMVIVEATIDDMNPQIYDYVMQRLFDAGAADVTLEPVLMKKNRIGFILSCQTPWHKKDKAIAVILRETTSLGVRYYSVDRKVLTREIKTVTTKLGRVRVKIARDEKLGIVKKIPEYDDMKRLAKAKRVPLTALYGELLALLNRIKP